MPLIQELDRSQIDMCLSEAVRRQVPVSMTCRIRGVWYNLRSGIIRQSCDKLWLKFPANQADTAEDRPEITEGLMLGLTFKLGHHKHIFNTPIKAVCPIATDSGESLIAVCVPVPSNIQRVQRRAYCRVDVPPNRSVLATFWYGGQNGDKSLKWEGWVTNISAGGFQVRLPNRSAPNLSIGDVIGVRIKVGQEFKPVSADAQFRQCISDGRGVVMLGFQFVGLNESQRGRETLERIGQIVRGFRRHQGRRRAGGAA
ncbi:MAG: PilZ domain-containing protein [Planctomycetota bacterium]|nr:PilZ domain-containing protein [Planctomycetota bacterium]